MLKKGPSGRLYRSDEEKAQLIREAEAASSLKEYAKATGIDPSAIYRWRKELREKQEAATLTHPLNGTPKRRGRPPKSQALIPTVLLSPRHILSVDDMINAFKVERDMLNEIIAKMERMRVGH